MKKIILGFVLLLGSFTAFCQIVDYGLMREGYGPRVKTAFLMIADNKKIVDQEIEFLIPVSVEEAVFMYSYTSPDSSKITSLSFYTFMDMASVLAEHDKLNSFIKYLKWAEFVDGEVADFYFDFSDRVIKVNFEKFCQLYPILNEGAALKLSRYGDKCK